MKSGNKQINNVVTLDIDKCYEEKKTGEWLGWQSTEWFPGVWGSDTKWSLHSGKDPPRVPYAFLSHRIPFGHKQPKFIPYFCITDTSNPIFLQVVFEHRKSIWIWKACS